MTWKRVLKYYVLSLVAHVGNWAGPKPKKGLRTNDKSKVSKDSQLLDFSCPSASKSMFPNLKLLKM